MVKADKRIEQMVKELTDFDSDVESCHCGCAESKKTPKAPKSTKSTKSTKAPKAPKPTKPTKALPSKFTELEMPSKARKTTMPVELESNITIKPRSKKMMGGAEKPKRKLNDVLRRRNLLVRQVRDKEGCSWIEASKMVKSKNMKF